MSVLYSEEQLKSKISKMIKTNNFSIKRLVKKSIDARDKSDLLYILTVDIESPEEKQILKRSIKNNNITEAKDMVYRFPVINDIRKEIENANRPVIVGAGPAGYFCGLYLARNGFRPIILERGKSVEDRSVDVESFWQGEKINPNSNVSFGEGGAGTFSDGKLNTGIKDKTGRINAVVKDFISFGAGEEIAYNNKPHVGTDVLKKVMHNMREEIIRQGGEIYFNTLFRDFSYIDSKGKVTDNSSNYYGINIECKDLLSGKQNNFNASCLILAIGHSSRDTFLALKDKLPMEAKAFAVGLRVEHKSLMINEAQYGKSDLAKALPTADYKMTYHSSMGRSVYSFCMCPGGYVVNASSGENQSVVNGMSYHDRAAENSNSAIVVNVTPEDFINEGFGKYGVLSGMYFQEKYEKLAFEAGKGKIPVQLFGDYKSKRISDGFRSIKPCLKGSYEFADLNICLPEYVNNAIIEGISYYDGKLKGFAMEDAVLSGVESRTSSPVRIIRNENFMSEAIGIFPCGEGAGYAGGITSAAVDGIKVAEAAASFIISNRKA